MFDKDGYIANIIGTRYDHEGKATFIKELCETKWCKTEDIVFIGNGWNDEWVSSTGVKTICLNPDKSDFENIDVWNKVIYTNDLLDLEKELYG